MGLNRLAPLFFFLLLLLPIPNSEDMGSVVHFNSQTANIVLTDFTITPDSLNQGETADFAITMQNTGLSAATVNASVYIYNSLGVRVSTFIYDPVVIGPGATTIVVKTWDSDSLPAGLYTAYANATYNTNATNRLSANFTIRTIPPTPPGPGGGGAGGGGGGPAEKPQPVPTSIIPVGEHVRFGKVPAVKEILAGEGELESLTIISATSENVSMQITVSGVPEGWIKMSQNVSVVFAGGSTPVNFLLDVPEDVLSGNYLVTFEAQGYGYYAKDYMLLRVKNYPKWHQYPIYLKTIRTDLLEGRTHVSIRFKNPSENNIKLLTAKETIPQSLKRGPLSLDFENKRGVVSNIGGTDVIMWNVSDFGPLEEMVISYSLNNVLSDYHEYGVWHLRQLEAGGRLDIASLVRIIDLSSQTISPGSSGDVTATILYAGEEPLDVTAALELPAGFTADPGYTSLMLLPRGLTNVVFRITAPRDVQQTHLIRAVVMGKNFNVYSAAPIVVRRGEGTGAGLIAIGGGSGSGGSATIATLSLPWIEIAGVAVLAVLALAVLMSVLSSGRSALGGIGEAGSPVQRPVYDFQRVKDMGVIRRIISGSIKGAKSDGNSSKKYLT